MRAGLALAKGEYVIFWDADVVGEPEMLEKMVSALAPQPEASIAYTNHYFGKKKMQAMEWNTDALMHHNYIHANLYYLYCQTHYEGAKAKNRMRKA